MLFFSNSQCFGAHIFVGKLDYVFKRKFIKNNSQINKYVSKLVSLDTKQEFIIFIPFTSI